MTDDEIRAAMARARGRVREAAALLGVSRQAVYARLAGAGVVLGPRTAGWHGKKGEKPTKKDETGRVYGRLTVLPESRRAARGAWHWLCHCECGAALWVGGNMLRSGRTRSCGCLQREAAQAVGLANRRNR